MNKELWIFCALTLTGITASDGNAQAIVAPNTQGAGQARQSAPAADADVVGMWVTENGFIRLELLPDGRYDEARGERKSVYKGRYTVTGNRLHFADDSGFTATGTIVDGVLTAGPDRFRKE